MPVTRTRGYANLITCISSTRPARTSPTGSTPWIHSLTLAVQSAEANPLLPYFSHAIASRRSALQAFTSTSTLRNPLCDMARLNTRPSHASSRRFASQTPAPNDSDEENRDPTRIRDKGKGRSRVEMPATNTSSTLPMPSSVPSDELGGQQQRKRKRVGVALTEEQEENAKFIKYYDPDQDTAERQETNRRSRALRREIQGRHTLPTREPFIFPSLYCNTDVKLR